MLEASQPTGHTATVLPFPGRGRLTAPDSPLAAFARELDTCSPELRELIRHACAYGGAAQEVTPEGTAAARMVLGECLDRWTDDARFRYGRHL